MFTLSLEGEVRVANRRLCEILGRGFTALIGHPLSEFIDSPTLAEANGSLASFLECGLVVGHGSGATQRRHRPQIFRLLAADAR